MAQHSLAKRRLITIARELINTEYDRTAFNTVLPTLIAVFVMLQYFIIL